MRLKFPAVRWIGVAIACCLILLFASALGDALPFTPGAMFSDAATSHYGAAFYLRESVLERGTFPLWQNTILIGQPFAANPLNKTAYPLQYLVLLLPPTLHLNAMIALHILLAVWGMWRWARALGLRWEAAAVSAIAYALAPRVLAHTGAGHLDILYALAWWPHLMAATERLLQLEHKTERAVVETALMAALVLTADVRTAFFAFALAGAVLLWRGVGLWQREGKRNLFTMALPRFGLTLIIAAMLSAALIVPLLAWMPSLTRAGLTAAEAGAFSLDPVLLLGLFIPQSNPQIEFFTYLGLLPFMLAVAALLAPKSVQPHKGRVWFWIGACLLAILFAFGLNSFVWPTLVNILPALAWFRVPARAWLVVALLVPLLAGYGFHALLNAASLPTSRLPRGSGFTTIAAILIALMTLILSTLLRGGAAPDVQAVPFSLLTLLIMVVPRTRQILSPRLLTVIGIITLVIDLSGIGVQVVEWRPQTRWLTPYNAVAEFLQEENAGRVYSPDYGIPQQAAWAYGLNLFYGVDPFQLSGVVNTIEQGSGVPNTGYSVVQPPLTGITGDSTAGANATYTPDLDTLRAWGVTHVVAGSGYPPPGFQNVSPALDAKIGDQGVQVFRVENALPQQSTAFEPFTGWRADAFGQNGFPTPAEVEQRNSLTLAAHLVSALTFLISFAALVFFAMRSHPRADHVQS